MKLYQVDAIVLRSVECGKGDKLLLLFSRRLGRIKVIAHGVSKPSSRKRGFVQPFTYSKFLIRRGRELDSVSQCEGIAMFPFLRQSLAMISYASYLAELTLALTLEGEKNEPLFQLILETMRLLESGEAEILTRSFEIKAVSLVGYRPVLDICAGCGQDLTKDLFFSAGGGTLCEVCGLGDQQAFPINKGVVGTLKALLNLPQDRLHQLKVSPAYRRQIRTLLSRYLKYYLERDLKSAAFIDQFIEDIWSPNV